MVNSHWSLVIQNLNSIEEGFSLKYDRSTLVPASNRLAWVCFICSLVTVEPSLCLSTKSGCDILQTGFHCGKVPGGAIGQLGRIWTSSQWTCWRRVSITVDSCEWLGLMVFGCVFYETIRVYNKQMKHVWARYASRWLTSKALPSTAQHMFYRLDFIFIGIRRCFILVPRAGQSLHQDDLHLKSLPSNSSAYIRYRLDFIYIGTQRFILVPYVDLVTAAALNQTKKI